MTLSASGVPGQRGHVVRVEAVDGGVVADPELHRIPPMRLGSHRVTVDDDRSKAGAVSGASEESAAPPGVPIIRFRAVPGSSLI